MNQADAAAGRKRQRENELERKRVHQREVQAKGSSSTTAISTEDDGYFETMGGFQCATCRKKILLNTLHALVCLYIHI